MSAELSPPKVVNFGGNIRFQPETIFAPRNESELVDLLEANRGKRIRAIGRLHSWSEATVGEEIVINLEHLTRITVGSDGEAVWADVEAGCSIKQVINELDQQGYTLPSVGLIQTQSLVGAASTGTHGSGRHSLSHYVQEVRLVAYDTDSGQASIRTIGSGTELLAARCALGCLGIITSVRVPIRKQYHIEEQIRRYDSLVEVLTLESTYPLQQFFLVPWRWDYFAQQRGEAEQPRSRLAWLYRLYWAVGMDLAFHQIIWLLARALPRFCTKLFYRCIMPLLVPQGWKVVDRSDRQLTMEHQLFRHIEIEIFVRRAQLTEAIEYITWLLKHLGGEIAEQPKWLESRLTVSGQWSELQSLSGVYAHHYPICVRKVLPDETLISMTSATDEASYALSFISYAHPDNRDGFIRFAKILAQTMAELFLARPHWGKYCPLSPEVLRSLYPHWDEFANICEASGSAETFANNWLQSILATSLTTSPSDKSYRET